MTHYVRTGDSVEALIREAQDVNEYAFALGALSHYMADIHGHPYVNLSVGIEYPVLAQLYGPSVPYDVDNKAHLRVEFGFDVLQVAKGRYAPEDYHNFIGFEVAQAPLERAFRDTYGLELKDVMPNEQLAIGTYRRSVSQILPEMTKVALLVKGEQLKREIPNFNRERFLYHLSRADYRRSWGTGYKEPGPGAHILAGIFKILPKVGALHAIDFKEPTTKTEDLYFKSVDETVKAFSAALKQVKQGNFQGNEIDLDTGKPTMRGEYPLADYTYRELLDQLSSHNFAAVDAPLRDNLLNFYQNFPASPPGDKRLDHCVIQRWNETSKELAQLRRFQAAPSSNQPQPSQTASLDRRPVQGCSN
jgi:Zinc dependent phospholipase C